MGLLCKGELNTKKLAHHRRDPRIRSIRARRVVHTEPGAVFLELAQLARSTRCLSGWTGWWSRLSGRSGVRTSWAKIGLAIRSWPATVRGGGARQTVEAQRHLELLQRSR